MAIRDREAPTATPRAKEEVTNGVALAAFLAAGIGAFALGLIVLLGEADVFSPPTLYGPSGGVSGRTTLAVVVWLIAWAVLHARWKNRTVQPGRVWIITLILIALGILGTFPPFWALIF